MSNDAKEKNNFQKNKKIKNNFLKVQERVKAITYQEL
jgi:hypothetical protein